MHYKVSQFDMQGDVLVQEASTLETLAVLANITAGRGITIDGNEFLLSHTDVQSDDIAGWNFVPTLAAKAAMPNIVRVLIIND